MFSFFKKKDALYIDANSTPLLLFNTMSNTVEVFSPKNSKETKLYTCGPTVYDYVHIGNFRSFIFADILKRVLIYNKYSLKHVMNFTDFGHLTDDADDGEDKMMLALERSGADITRKNMLALADTYIDAYKEDAGALNILPPTEYARASKFIREQITLIRTLVEKGYTYETKDGVYFDISRFPTYGKLGNIDLHALKEGARVMKNPDKKHPADFALWKKGALGWSSPWGEGFPGWHTECTAMIIATLGKQIDIHTGGIDHIPTHHNGEIAQAEAATGRSPYVRYWMHNAFVAIENKRIGKSEGNAITVKQLRDRGYSPLDYRYWLLTGHYRSPMNFTFTALDGAKQALFRLRRTILEHTEKERGTIIETYKKKFHTAINDDLNTPRAIALIWELLKDDAQTMSDKIATIRHFDTVLGLSLNESFEDATRALGVLRISDLPEDVAHLIQKREQARSKKSWDEADTYRTSINMKGYIVEDTPQGPKITRSES